MEGFYLRLKEGSFLAVQRSPRETREEEEEKLRADQVWLDRIPR